MFIATTMVQSSLGSGSGSGVCYWLLLLLGLCHSVLGSLVVAGASAREAVAGFHAGHVWVYSVTVPDI